MKARIGSLVVAIAALIMGVAVPASAYVRGAAARPANVQSARTNVANRNVNVNQNVNRNVNVNDNRGYRGGGCCYDNWGHPVAAAVAVTATAVAVGTIAASLPESGCTGVSVGGVSYQRCGPNYYQPVVQNGTTQYVVVNAPR
jgi:hypothetical protein